jgi:hypothetical protein
MSIAEEQRSLGPKADVDIGRRLAAAKRLGGGKGLKTKDAGLGLQPLYYLTK